MKKGWYIIALLLFICTNNIQAQKGKCLSKEEFRAKQEAFFVEQNILTQEEAKQFFPLYFELQDKKHAYNKKAWQLMRQGKNENLSEEEQMKVIENVIKTKIEINELDLEYVHKYKAFLSAKKIYRLQRAEMRFHRELLKPNKKR